MKRWAWSIPASAPRKEIRAEIERAGRAPHGPAGEPLYPGTCRHLTTPSAGARIEAGEPMRCASTWRGARARPARSPGTTSARGTIAADPGLLGDVVLARKDVPTSYHLAVTVDDTLQGVTLVTRGEDLFHATHIHRLLQALLGLRTPRYYHHNLLADSTGQRLAKRNRAVTVRYLRERGQSPDDIWQAIERGLPAMAEAG